MSHCKPSFDHDDQQSKGFIDIAIWHLLNDVNTDLLAIILAREGGGGGG